MKQYNYYRAGILIARFQISADTVLCSPRDLKTMEFAPYAPFALPLKPFEADLDKRLADAVALLQQGALPEGYELMAEVSGGELKGEMWIQPLGKNPLDVVLCDGRIVATIDNERNYIGLMVEEGFEPLTPQAAMGEELLSKPTYGIEFIGTEMVEMRDGIKLATDIYLPTPRAEGQKFPTVLIRTCYNKFGVGQFFCFAHYGYAVVAQDTRGRELSEGVWQPIINEKDDGDDTLNWLAAQPWSDGGAGMIGASYLAIVQWQVAASGNPHLKAMISMVTGGVPMFDFPHASGVLSPGTMAWCSSMRTPKFDPSEMLREDWDEVLLHRPIRELPLRGIGEEIPFWTEWMDHEYYDGYWHKANFLVNQHKIDYPCMYVSGWYDDVNVGSMQTWEMMKRNQRKNQKLISGAWLHKMNVCRDIHNIYFGSNAIRHDMFYQYLRWYDRFLKGIENGIDKEPPVDYFTIGENKWHTATAWPPLDAVDTELYLDSCGKANTSNGDGKLAWDYPTTAATDDYTYDPADPTPFLIDVSENECKPPENYREVELRDDVLVYTTAPLEKDVTITGEPKAVIYAASDAKDTDWVVRITDVDEEGNSTRLSDGIIRAKYRRSFIEPVLLLPGEIVRYEIPLTWISNRFVAGHRIRVEVTSGADNSIFPNTNTGLPLCDDVDTVIAHQKVYHGGRYPSCVILPIMPEEA
ncbi:MAG: CocE/NonD family hydrolase [Firmicutes bacterium]|nr:CocE/NonD family hydrolase [Bacillota bacterium]